MSNPTIANIRLMSQQLLEKTTRNPEDIVSWMGAMQAQDYNMAKWAIGIRISGSTEKEVEKAFNEGKILRTHVMRPTWHFVTPKNIRWMLELTAPRIKSSIKSRDRELGLTEDVYTKSNNIIRKSLEGKHLTREELAGILEKSGIPVDLYRISHLMMRAELEGIICSGTLNGKKHTYALLDERVPQQNHLNKDEALAKLAGIYFLSHSPATLQDFIWWSGLTVSEARHAQEMIKQNFIAEIINSQVYWIANVYSNLSVNNESIHLLPAFDEYIISYKDRTAVLFSENHSKAISSNGIFRPTIMKNGQVIGVWRKATAKNKPLTINFFEQQDKSIHQSIENASSVFNAFLK